MTLVRRNEHFKPIIENELANLIYNVPCGLANSSGFDCLYQGDTERVVNGTAKVKLYRELARNRKFSLKKVATYTSADTFDQDRLLDLSALGLPTEFIQKFNVVKRSEKGMTGYVSLIWGGRFEGTVEEWVRSSVQYFLYPSWQNLI